MRALLWLLAASGWWNWREKPRYGYRRLHVLLDREGEHVNHKRVHRIYREAGLTLRARNVSTERLSMPLGLYIAPHQEWAPDFVRDAVVLVSLVFAR